MKVTEPRIIFMGTPEFAVASLKILVENRKNVVAVITAPDKPAGRGMKLRPSPVKIFATENGIPVLQPEKLKDTSFLKDLLRLNAGLQVVVAFRMLPEEVWNMPRLGTFNLHASLLPQYRGAAPINRAIMNGEKETGVTTFFIEHTIDTGTIIFREKVKIGDNETAGELHDRLMVAGAGLVLKTVEAVRNGDYPRIPQHTLICPGEKIHAAPKIFSDDCRIDWSLTAGQVYDHIRGLSPYPAAWTVLEFNGEASRQIKIFDSEKIEKNHGRKPGSVLTDGKTYLHV
ncbi:MAG: methionyl-tRNA formyltransferase, partial [Bacteroidetes bacterium]|nr:methionyl-tRNA formyltransferase [Bacteroidota bacterium]